MQLSWNLFQTQSVDRNVYMYRSYIAQKKYRVVLDEIDAARMPELVPIRYIAEYFAFPDRKNQILSALEKHELDAEELTDTWALSFAYIHYSEENYSEALRLEGTPIAERVFFITNSSSSFPLSASCTSAMTWSAWPWPCSAC